MCNGYLRRLYAAEVRAVAGVDFDFVAGVYEQRHTYLGSGFNGGGLKGVGGGIALDAGFGIGDFEHGLYGHFGEEDSFGRRVAYYFNSIAFLHKGRAGNEFLVDRNLLVGFVVHEYIIAAVCIQVLVWTTLYTHVFELFADVEAAFEHTAVNHVLELRAHERVALAGLHMKEFDYEI